MVLDGTAIVSPPSLFKTPVAYRLRIILCGKSILCCPLNVRTNQGRLEVRSNFFSVRVTEKWNMIPSEIKTMKSVKTFKDAYKRYRRPTVPV